MSILGYCALTLLALSVLVVFNELTPKYSKTAAVLIGVCLLTAAFAKFFPSIKYISESIKATPFDKWGQTLLKALGVAIAVEITADICRDAGEQSLAHKLELVGKAELLLLALPLVRELLELAGGLVS